MHCLAHFLSHFAEEKHFDISHVAVQFISANANLQMMTRKIALFVSVRYICALLRQFPAKQASSQPTRGWLLSNSTIAKGAAQYCL